MEDASSSSRTLAEDSSSSTAGTVAAADVKKKKKKSTKKKAAEQAPAPVSWNVWDMRMECTFPLSSHPICCLVFYRSHQVRHRF